VTGGDRGLQRVGPEHAPQLLGTLEGRQAATDEELIPASAVLIEQKDRLSRGPGPRAQARGLDLHQRRQAVHLRLFRNELGQDAAQTERILAERGPHPVVSRGRRVAFVEHEVDDFEHRRQAGGAPFPARDLEGDARFGQGPLGPDDPLGDGRLGDEERTRDLVGRQAAEQAEGERDAGLGGKHRMAGREHEAQEVVADVVVDRGFEIRHRRLQPGKGRSTELLVLALEQLAPAQPVDRAIPGGGHEPGARVVRNARLRPPFERHHESVLRELLGQADVAHHPRQAGDEPGRLDPKDRFDGAMGVGSRHGCRTLSQRDQRLQARLAEVDPEPDEESEHDLDEERVADAPVCADRATDVSRQENRTQDRRRRDQIDHDARDLEDRERPDHRRWESKMSHPLHHLGSALQFQGCAEQEEERRQTRDHSPNPHDLSACCRHLSLLEK
jgi:hypothetical protein